MQVKLHSATRRLCYNLRTRAVADILRPHVKLQQATVNRRTMSEDKVLLFLLDFTPGTLRSSMTTSTSESRDDYDKLGSKKSTNHNKREEACPGESLLDCTPGTFRIIITTSTNENRDDGGSMTR